jgi:hypothetical protein
MKTIDEIKSLIQDDKLSEMIETRNVLTTNLITIDFLFKERIEKECEEVPETTIEVHIEDYLGYDIDALVHITDIFVKGDNLTPDNTIREVRVLDYRVIDEKRNYLTITL